MQSPVLDDWSLLNILFADPALHRDGQREKLVLDATCIASGIARVGLDAIETKSCDVRFHDINAHRAVDKAVTTAPLIATTETLRTLIGELHPPKFDRYVRRERRDALLERVASLVDVLQQIRASRDQKDDKFLEAATSR
jgi:hypothetical protein